MNLFRMSGNSVRQHPLNLPDVGDTVEQRIDRKEK